MYGTRNLLIAAALAAGVAFPTFPAEAQYPTGPPCADRKGIVELLAARFGEQVQSRGVSNSGLLVEVYVSSATRTWTILATAPNGQSCLIAVGGNWDTAHESITIPPADSDVSAQITATAED